MSVQVEQPNEAKSMTVKKYTKNIRRRRVFPIFSSGDHSNSSYMIYDVTGDQAVDLSSHVFYFQVSGFDNQFQCINPKSFVQYIDVSAGGVHLETIHDYDLLEKMIHIVRVDEEKDNLHYGGWGFNNKSLSNSYYDVLTQNAQYRTASYGTAVNGDPNLEGYIDAFTNPYNADNASRYAYPNTYLNQKLYGANEPRSLGEVTIASYRASAREVLHAHLGQLKLGNNDAIPANAIQADPNTNANKRKWYSLKLTASGLMMIKKHFPLKLVNNGKITITIQISSSVSKCLMNISDWNPRVTYEPKLTIHDSYVQMDEIEYPQEWWSMMNARMNSTGLNWVFDSAVTQKTKAGGATNETFVITERRRFLKYLLMGFYNSSNHALPLITSEAGKNDDFSDVAGGTCYFAPARPDPLSIFPRGNILEYDVKVNGQSMLWNKVIVYDPDGRVDINEAYYEYAKVSEIINDGETKLSVRPANYVTDKFLLSCAFASGLQQDDPLQDVIDSIDNTVRTGQIVVTLRQSSQTAKINTGISVVAFSTIMNLRNGVMTVYN